MRCFFSLFFLSAYSLMANPQGAEVFAGCANFSESGTELQIATNGRTILNWDSFSIASDEVTRFVQDAPVLNRVIGINPSHLLGRLEANGEIYLLNPQGVLISRDAVIQTAGFIASTLDLDNELFLAGGKLEFFGDSIASIVFEGTSSQVLEEGGRFFLVGNDLTEVNGSISASEVRILGDKVHLSETATIVAPGGEVLIGGDYKGQNPEVRNAQLTQIDKGAEICVDGREGEDGGKVIVWADQGTWFGGNISARGINGGFVEVSGKEKLFYRGFSDLRGMGGDPGNLLLDPKTILIQAGGPDPVLGQTFAFMSALPQTIDNGALSLQIDLGTVTLEANSDITFDGNVTGTIAGRGLICRAGCSIIFNAGRILTLNMGDFTATTNFNSPPVVFADRSCPTTTDPQFLMNPVSSILTGGGNVTIDHQMFNGLNIGNVTLLSATINSGAGSISITGDGTTTFPIGINVAGSTLMTSGTGTTALTGNGDPNGLVSNIGVDIVGGSLITAVNGDISITGMGGGTAAGFSNVGIRLAPSGGTISSTGGGPTAATITLMGTGGNGTGNNVGILKDLFTTLTSIDGDITLIGTGNGTMTFNIGVVVLGTVTSTGVGANAADIMITGLGGNGTDLNIGVLINAAGFPSTFSSVDGDIIVNGTGAGSGTMNYGIWTIALIDSTMTGQITLTGIAGMGLVVNEGVRIERPVTTVDGDITVTGTGNPLNSFDHGVDTQGIGSISSSGAGNILIQSLFNAIQFSNPVTTTTGVMSILAVNPSSSANILFFSDITCGSDFIAAANNNIIIGFGNTINVAGNGSMIVDEQSGPAAGPGFFTNNGTIISGSNNFAIYAVAGPTEPAGLPIAPSQVFLGSLMPPIDMWDIAIPPIPLNAKYSTSYQAGGPHHGPGFGAVYVPGNGVFGSIVIWYKELGFLIPGPIPPIPFELPFSPLALIGINADASEKYFLRPFAPCPILPCLKSPCEHEEICLPELYSCEEPE